MFKRIIVEESEAMKLPVAIYGEGNNTVKERVSDEEFEHTFVIFTDVEGNKYLLTHGTRDGMLQYNLNSGKKSELCMSMLYEMLVDLKKIEAGEKINIICCHGAKVAKFQENVDAIGMTHRYPMNTEVVNMTCDPCTMDVVKRKNGTFSVSVFSMSQKLGKVSMYVDAIRSVIRSRLGL